MHCLAPAVCPPLGKPLVGHPGRAMGQSGGASGDAVVKDGVGSCTALDRGDLGPPMTGDT